MHLTSLILKEATQSLLDEKDTVQLKFEEETTMRDKSQTFLVETQIDEAQKFISYTRDKNKQVFTYLKPQTTEVLMMDDLLILEQIYPVQQEETSEAVFSKFRTKPRFKTIKQETESLNDIDDIHDKNLEIENKEVTYKENENEKDLETVELEDIEDVREKNQFNISSLQDAYDIYTEDISMEIDFNELMKEVIHDIDKHELMILNLVFDYGRLMNERHELITLKQAYLKTSTPEKVESLIEEVYKILNEEGIASAAFIFEEYIEDIKGYDALIFENYIEQVSNMI